MHRLIQKPQLFDGRTNLTAWLFSIATYLALCAPVALENQKILIAGSFLTGYALIWFRAHLNQFRKYDDFELALRRQFGDLQLSTTCRKKLERLTQHSSVAVYTASFNELALQLGPDFMDSEEGYHAYMRGLKDDCRINVTLTLRGEHSTAEAQALAAEYDAARSSLFNNQRFNGRPRVNKATPQRDMSRVRCYNCNKFGHYQSACPDRRTPPPPPPPKNGR